MEALAKRYDKQEWKKSNTCFKTTFYLSWFVTLTWRIFFIFYGIMMEKIGAKPLFTPFQRSILRLLKVGPSQLGLNTWLILITFEYLYTCIEGLELGTGYFFFSFNCSLRTKWGIIYFSQRPTSTYLLNKIPLLHKGWKDTFFKVQISTNKKILCWITCIEKLAFPLKWFVIEKRSF